MRDSILLGASKWLSKNKNVTRKCCITFKLFLCVKLNIYRLTY